MVGYKNLVLIDSHTYLKEASLIYDNSTIVYAGLTSEVPIELSENTHWKDGKGYWVSPGLTNSHTHVAMSFLREIAHESPSMIDRVFFPAEANLTTEQTQYFSYPSIMASIKSGVTCFVDHYYHIDGIAKAMSDVGARAVLCETLADLGGAKPSRIDLSKFNAYNPNDKISYILGPHAADTVSPDYQNEIGNYRAKLDSLVHMHLSQTEKEKQLCIKKYSMSPVELAYKNNILNEKTLAVHLVSVDQNDLRILKKSKAHIGFCPSSQILYEQLAPIDQFIKHNIPILLGTDCAASNDSMDIMSELKLFYLLCRDRGTPLDAVDILKTVWDNPNSWLQNKTGHLKPGYKADLVFYKHDLSREPVYNPHTHFIMSMSANDIQKVIIDGETIYNEHTFINIDEEKIKQKFFKHHNQFLLSYPELKNI